MYCFNPKLLTLLLALIMLAPLLCAQSKEVSALVAKLDSPAAGDRDEAFDELLDLEGIDRDLRISFRATSDKEIRIQIIELMQLRESDLLVSDALKLLKSDNSNQLSYLATEYLLSADLQSIKSGIQPLNQSQQNLANALLTFRLHRDCIDILMRSYFMPGDFLGKFEGLANEQELQAELLQILNLQTGLVPALERTATDIREYGINNERLKTRAWLDFKRVMDGIPQAVEVLRAGELSDNLAHPYRRDLHASIDLVQGVRAAAARAMSALGNKPNVQAIKKAYKNTFSLQITPSLQYAVAIGRLQEELEVTLAKLGHGELLDARISRLMQAGKVAAKNEPNNVTGRLVSKPSIQSLDTVGHLQHRSGDHKNAEQTWETLLKELKRQAKMPGNARMLVSLPSTLSVVYYNIACSQSMQVKLSRSLDNLKKANANGYKDFAWILVDSDLEALRETSSFKEWFKKYAPPAVASGIGG